MRMNVLIVESNETRARLWAKPLEAWGHSVTIVTGQRDAVSHLQTARIDVIVLNLHLHQGSALAVADFASYRQPHARVLAVTGDRCFSDGSIFSHLGNARALLPADVLPQDLGALVEYYAAA
jgi:CheY-like chemotaxis protein